MTECYCPTVISWGGNISRTRRNMAVKRREKIINIHPRYRKIKFEKFDTILFSIENKYILFFTFPDNNIIIIFDPWRFSAVIADVFLPNDVNAARLTANTRHYARSPSYFSPCTEYAKRVHARKREITRREYHPSPSGRGHERVQCEEGERDSRSPRKPLLWNFVNGRPGTISVIKMHRSDTPTPDGCEALIQSAISPIYFRLL